MRVDYGELRWQRCACGVEVAVVEVQCPRCHDPRRSARNCATCHNGRGFLEKACERARVIEVAPRWRVVDGLAVHSCRGRG